MCDRSPITSRDLHTLWVESEKHTKFGQSTWEMFADNLLAGWDIKRKPPKPSIRGVINKDLRNYPDLRDALLGALDRLEALEACR